MKLLRYGDRRHEKPGLLDQDNNIRDLSEVVDDITPAFLNSKNFSWLKTAEVSGLPMVPGQPRLAPPVAGVGKMICVGLNYRDHAQESGMDVPQEPILFMKATTAIVGPGDDVVIPRNAHKVDWEVELGIVIGKTAKYVPEARALDYIAGLTVVNDISEREFQLERGGQWVKGKGCDTFGPIGPYLVTLDELNDINALPIWLELNGERVQDGNTRTMVFDVPYLVHYISQFMRLEPGDIISTGTPPGVGLGMTPPRFLQVGDVMRLGIQGLGVQRQCVVAEVSADIGEEEVAR
ncbi:fumarylacetoacetate hydrolase family protein [Exilibacterium tricleocarpae]|uniref:Fumarylacetoacetate hydrolase family protein n=1 Tax=Exilibacterium tricleocarpae TaxID=2591008 RepID=A0A545TSI1_9GAMM|nr:fumarylacetoacetate hydrolase family protein [Exilibacterium tricleocarpae]TQV80101.1 fumarylacetoacetate hydrolase family protein [Exilibacterium tricleocarpae]